MKKIESSLTNMVTVLVVVAVIMGSLLAMVNNITAGSIAKQGEIALANGIKAVMGATELKVTVSDEVKQVFDKKEYTFMIHRVADAQGNVLGAAVESTAMAFGGDMKVLVGFDKDGKVLGYTILQTAETPGLGAKADKWFQKGEKGDIIGRQMDAQSPLSVNKDGGEIDAITASTITSRAFLKAVNQAYAAYNNK